MERAINALGKMNRRGELSMVRSGGPGGLIWSNCTAGACPAPLAVAWIRMRARNTAVVSKPSGYSTPAGPEANGANAAGPALPARMPCFGPGCTALPEAWLLLKLLATMWVASGTAVTLNCSWFAAVSIIAACPIGNPLLALTAMETLLPAATAAVVVVAPKDQGSCGSFWVGSVTSVRGTSCMAKESSQRLGEK